MPTSFAYLFLLGMACGIAFLPLSAYRRVSPPWLKWLLMATGLFTMSRYLTMALFTSPDAPQRFWALRHAWFASSLGLTLPSAFAIDQLLRHPAMTPKKLLGWVSPFVLVWAAAMLFGRFTTRPDRVIGWTVHLDPVWRGVLSGAHGLYSAGIIGVGVALSLRLPSRPIRVALIGLACAHAYLLFDGFLLLAGVWYFRPFFFSELLTLVAIWHAYETSADLQRSPNT